MQFADFIKQKNVITVYKYENFIANIIKFIRIINLLTQLKLL